MMKYFEVIKKHAKFAISKIKQVTTFKIQNIMATINLQGIGSQNATLVSNVKVGDTLVWNYGYTSEVVGIAKETKAQIIFLLKSNGDGVVRERRLAKSTLVAVA